MKHLLQRRTFTILLTLALMFIGLTVVHARVPHACQRGPRGECSHGNKDPKTNNIDVCDVSPWCSLQCFVGIGAKAIGLK